MFVTFEIQQKDLERGLRILKKNDPTAAPPTNERR